MSPFDKRLYDAAYEKLKARINEVADAEEYDVYQKDRLHKQARAAFQKAALNNEPPDNAVTTALITIGFY